MERTGMWLGYRKGRPVAIWRRVCQKERRAVDAEEWRQEQ